MATQKKGCGFLITSIILIIIMAAAMGIGIYSAAKAFSPITSFNTPHSGEITTDDSTAISVWLHGNDTSIPAGIVIQVTDIDTGKLSTAPLTKTNSHIEVNGDRRILLGAFKTDEGKKYKIRVAGLSEGRKVSLSKASTGGMAAIFGTIGLSCPCGVLALIFGIIGLVKFFGSKNTPAQAPPVAAPPAM